MAECEETQTLVFSHLQTVPDLTSRPRTTDVIVVVRPYIGFPNSVWNVLPMVRATQRARPSCLRSSAIAELVA